MTSCFRLIGSLLLMLTATVSAQTMTFTYQGQLLNGGEPYSGTADLEFELFGDADGNFSIGVDGHQDHAISNGLFKAVLNFDMGGREIPEVSFLPLHLGIKVNGQPMTPLQAITPAPLAYSSGYAFYAMTAGAPWEIVGDDIQYMNGRVGVGREPSDFFVIDSGLDMQASDFSFGTGALRVIVRDPATGGPLTKLRVLGNGGVAIGNSFNSSGVPENGLRVHGLSQIDGGLVSSNDFTAHASSYFNSSVFAHLFEPAAGGTTDLCRSTLASPSYPDRYGLTYCTSSARFKHEITDVSAAMELVERLRPVSFLWNESGEPDLGLVAEEVAEIEPRLVTLDADGRIQGVKYRNLAAVLVAALQEQRADHVASLAARDAEITALRNEFDAQRREITARLAALELLMTDSGQSGEGEP
jgi:hypothetical protein